MLALALLAKELGAERAGRCDARARPGRGAPRRSRTLSVDAIPQPERLLVLVGAGPSAVTAREGALKVREACALPRRGLRRRVPPARLRRAARRPRSPGGALPARSERPGRGRGASGEAEGIPVTRLVEPADLPAALAQIPLTVRLQLLALRFAVERSQDPDTVIVGAWDDPATWAIGAP